MGFVLIGWPVIVPPTPPLMTPALCFVKYRDCVQDNWEDYLTCMDEGNNPILCDESLRLKNKNCMISYQLCLDIIKPLEQELPFL